jgi:hypothetical protein
MERARATLALATAEFSRPALQQVLQFHPTGGALHGGLDLGHRLAAQQARIGDVVAYRHVRIEPVVLEHHGHVAQARRDAVDALRVEIQVTGGRLFQPGDHAHGGGLAASGGPQEDQEFAVLDLQIEILDGMEAVPFLVYALQAQWSFCLLHS